MQGIITFVLKVLQIAPLMIASVFGVLQVIVKALKEVVTAVVNTMFPLFPDNGKFEKFVAKVRDYVNKLDSGLEWVKLKILQPMGLLK